MIWSIAYMINFGWKNHGPHICPSISYLGVGADVGLVTRVGDAAGDVHEAVGVLVLLLPRREPVHATCRKKYFL